MQGRYQANGGGMTQDERKLVEVLLSIDTALPHDFPLPEDAPRPPWDKVVNAALIPVPSTSGSLMIPSIWSIMAAFRKGDAKNEA